MWAAALAGKMFSQLISGRHIYTPLFRHIQNPQKVHVLNTQVNTDNSVPIIIL